MATAGKGNKKRQEALKAKKQKNIGGSVKGGKRQRGKNIDEHLFFNRCFYFFKKNINFTNSIDIFI